MVVELELPLDEAWALASSSSSADLVEMRACAVDDDDASTALPCWPGRGVGLRQKDRAPLVRSRLDNAISQGLGTRPQGPGVRCRGRGAAPDRAKPSRQPAA
jgi:hypothetical protein